MDLYSFQSKKWTDFAAKIYIFNIIYFATKMGSMLWSYVMSYYHIFAIFAKRVGVVCTYYVHRYIKQTYAMFFLFLGR
jgi:hypothetical protein